MIVGEPRPDGSRVVHLEDGEPVREVGDTLLNPELLALVLRRDGRELVVHEEPPCISDRCTGTMVFNPWMGWQCCKCGGYPEAR